MLEVIKLALLHGVIISVFLTIVLLISLLINAEMWLNDYPPDVREKYGEMGDRAKKQRIPLAIAFFGAIIVPLSIGVAQIMRTPPNGPIFGALFLYGFITLFFFNLYDLLILDWLIFVTIQPAFIILPGTEGMSGYKDYYFHFKGFLKGIGFCTIGGLVVAVVGSLINLISI